MFTLSPHLSEEEKKSLVATANAVATRGKGITACDEGPATIGSRLEAVGLVNDEEQRRIYRQMLFDTPTVSVCVRDGSYLLIVGVVVVS